MVGSDSGVTRVSVVARAGGNALSKYDPAKGVQRIAWLQAAQKHFGKAKNVGALTSATRAKLEAQAEFVDWWKTKGPGGAGRPKKNSDRSGRILSAEDVANQLGTSLKEISRWHQRLNVSPEAFELAVRQAVDRYIKLCEGSTKGTKGLGLSLAVEWYTPTRYLDAARAVLGAIDLDPASSIAANKRVCAATFFTAADDGLKREWPGRVWLNPPYSGAAGAFVSRLIEQFVARITTAAILLINAHSTDVLWFQPLWDFPLCFTDHRINFIVGNQQEQSGSNHGSVFVYLGAYRQTFIAKFQQFGAVVERARI